MDQEEHAATRGGGEESLASAGGAPGLAVRTVAVHAPLGPARRRAGRGRRNPRPGRDDHRRGVSGAALRSEEHTSELQSLMRISYAVFYLKTKQHSLIYHLL